MVSNRAKIIAVCGIDTGVGKTIVTGLLAEFLIGEGNTVITQKPVQTGCVSKPEDIIVHRKLMNSTWNDDDEQGLTCSSCFPYPASPHLAARLAGQSLDLDQVTSSTHTLAGKYDFLLIEGAGGLMVPLTETVLWLDYLQECGYPMILVTSPRLGSINHTLLSLEAIKARGIRLLGMVYNLYGDHPLEIVKDSLQVFRRSLSDYGFSPLVVILPCTSESKNANWRILLTENE
jgi:dethiobiotin synthetase